MSSELAQRPKMGAPAIPETLPFKSSMQIPCEDVLTATLRREFEVIPNLDISAVLHHNLPNISVLQDPVNGMHASIADAYLS